MMELIFETIESGAGVIESGKLMKGKIEVEQVVMEKISGTREIIVETMDKNFQTIE
ncbi:hypothetical protein [Jeotgalibacillus sp. R-1-5s-1]|uniref:hypothetical protein n=1 Tax=Jeotgalibacillus sp. R-1-5s-1 TaxID=2555897 RepID=UPI00141B1E34|nr:hypothetical protein [Jeotgalibacillus sp. R-1-5s-1]